MSTFPSTISSSNAALSTFPQFLFGGVGDGIEDGVGDFLRGGAESPTLSSVQYYILLFLSFIMQKLLVEKHCLN